MRKLRIWAAIAAVVSLVGLGAAAASPAMASNAARPAHASVSAGHLRFVKVHLRFVKVPGLHRLLVKVDGRTEAEDVASFQLVIGGGYCVNANDLDFSGNGDAVISYTCNKQLNELWYEGACNSKGYCQVVSWEYSEPQYPNYCININDGGGGNDPYAQLWTCNLVYNDMWDISNMTLEPGGVFPDGGSLVCAEADSVQCALE
jgi:hypothetical protein